MTILSPFVNDKSFIGFTNGFEGGTSLDVFYPRSLFAAGEQGAWYDPSDLTTLFKDAAGTQPVTAPGDVVGLMLDKSGNGNHATQSGATSVRPIYGIVPQTGRRNLLTYTEDFSSAAWEATAVTKAAGALTVGATNAQHSVRQAYSAVSGVKYARQVEAKAAGISRITLRNSLIGQPDAVTFDLVAGTVVSGSGTITPLDDGWFRCEAPSPNGAVSSGFRGFDVYLNSASGIGPETWTGNGISQVLVRKAQAEAGTASTAYQKVVSQYDVTEPGVPSLHYLSFDGVDDWLQTGTITPGTDKVQVFAGVRKLSDAAGGIVVEYSAIVASNAGAFGLFAPSVAAPNYMFRSRGSAPQTDASHTNAAIAAPVSNALTGIGDIAADTNNFRVDGAQVAQSAADQGTGNYLAYPLYIGRRAGTSLPFNGHLYGLVVRFGANLSAAQISNAERWMARKTGVTI